MGWLERGKGSEPVFLDGWVLPQQLQGSSLEARRQEWAGQFGTEAELFTALKQARAPNPNPNPNPDPNPDPTLTLTLTQP